VLSASATSVYTGATVVATLINGLGGASDWLALAPVGAPDTTYALRVAPGAGVTTYAWSVAMPSTTGQYEFRLFDGSNVRLASSTPVTVSLPPPPPTLSVSASNVYTAATVTATLSNGVGGASDWLALATVGSPDTSYVQHAALGAGTTTYAWSVVMPSVGGQYEFRLFNGANVRLASSAPVTVTLPPPPPAISVNANTVYTKASVTATLTNATGVAGNWLALALVGAADASYVQQVSLATGTTTYVWNVTMPVVVGQYEFRLFNAANTRLTTSAPVTVVLPPVTGPTLTVDTTSAVAGTPVTVTLEGGPGGAQDFLVFAAKDAPNSTYLQFMWVGAGVTTRTWTVTVPSTYPAAYEFRLFLNNSFATRAATSPTITTLGPTLSVSATSVARGASVTVTLTNGLGGSTDWLILAASGAANSNYLQWTYVGAGIHTRTWTVTMPTTPGTYDFRLLLGGGFTLLATSQPVTVGP
jgi:hypothetical protein